MSVKIVEWHGDAILKRLDEAQRLGIDTTMLACVRSCQARRARARLAHYRAACAKEAWQVAHKEGGRWVGRWGSFDVNYALWQEISTCAHVCASALPATGG